jgi:membrane protein DedA with SNARE-associated domain
VINWIIDVIGDIGLAGVAFLVALESIVPPIPSEVVLLLTGSNVESGRFDLIPAILLSTVGSVVGALVLYGLGYWLSADRMERLIARLGRFVGLKQKDVDRGFRWFERHGSLVVFFGRLIPLVRSVVSIPAGAERMNLVRFISLTALGSAIWNTVWIVAGNALGKGWERAQKWADLIQYVAIGLIALALVAIIVRARRRSATPSA